MANPTAGFGFRPVQSDGGDSSVKMTEYPIAAAYATLIGQGDLVEIIPGTGYVKLYDGAGEPAVGVAMGAHLGVAASADKTILVCDDPNQVFLVKNSSVVATDLSDLGDIIGVGCWTPAALASASSTTNQSVATIAGATVATTGSLAIPFIAVGFSKDIDNDNALINNDILVKFCATGHAMTIVA